MSHATYDANDPYTRGFHDGMMEAARLVMCAPTSMDATQRITDGPGGIRRVMDNAVDKDGDPGVVWNTYAHRDFILSHIDDRLTAMGFE